MRTRKAILMAAVLATASTGALAQGPSRLTRHAERNDGADVTRIWAECVADLDENWSRSLLDTLPTTEAEDEIWARHIGYNDRCLTNNELLMYGKQVTFTSNLARGEIARRLTRNALRDKDAVRTPGSATAWLRDKLAALPQGTPYDRATLIGHQFALCMADEHWPLVREFVAANPGSKAENTALAALSPKFAACMTQGANLKLSKPIVRLLLSEAAYHALTHRTTGMAR